MRPTTLISSSNESTDGPLSPEYAACWTAMIVDARLSENQLLNDKTHNLDSFDHARCILNLVEWYVVVATGTTRRLGLAGNKMLNSS